MNMEITKIADFKVNGRGTAPAWEKTQWLPMSPVGSHQADYPTRTKVLYSDTGLYFLVDCEDRKLDCTGLKDFDNLYTEDVVEVFLWPDTSQNLYFEYEISPLGAELPILVANNNGRFFGWLPWHYKDGRRTHKATSVRGGRKEAGASVTGWTVEFFIPYNLLVGLGNTPPKPGTHWRGNIYRIDHEKRGHPFQWAWCSKINDFHDFKNFGTLVFR